MRAGLVAVLHLPRVIEHVVGGVPDHELDRPAPSRDAPRVVVTDRSDERVTMTAEFGGVPGSVLPHLFGRDHADLPCELLDLRAVRVAHDPIPVATSTPRTLRQL